MAKRPAVPKATLTEVLVSSARRCCVCFGLHQEDKVKQGQIAHLNGERSDNDPDNLVFLCLDHHDELDSRTSQSKGLTTDEVRHYRDVLHSFIKAARDIPSKSRPPLQGVWDSWGGYRSISIQEIGAGVYRVWGVAIDNPEKEAPNLGLFDAVCTGSKRSLRARQGMVDISVDLISDRDVRIEDNSELGAFGMGVRFTGDYELTGQDIKLPDFQA